MPDGETGREDAGIDKVCDEVSDKGRGSRSGTEPVWPSTPDATVEWSSEFIGVKNYSVLVSFTQFWSDADPFSAGVLPRYGRSGQIWTDRSRMA